MAGDLVVVELAFDDDTERLPLRARHREILTELHEAGEVVTAGPFADGSGSIVVFSAGRDRVDEVLAADPYYSAAGVRIVAVRDVTPLFPSPPTTAGAP